MPLKLSKNSPAMLLLRKKFESGEVTGVESPKSVHESEALFKRHKLNNFRTQYNALKKEYMTANNDNSSQFVLTPRCSNEYGPSAKHPKLFEEAEECDEDGDDDIDISAVPNEKCPTASREFQTLFLISNWKENSTMRRRLTIAVLLPSGVEKGIFSLRVLEGGKCLEITVRWPQPLLEITMLHRMFLRNPNNEYKNYHPEYTGSEECLRNLRDNNKDSIESSTQINLPFPVETHIHEKFNLSWEASPAKVLYIRLKAVVEQYGISNDNEEFIVL